MANRRDAEVDPYSPPSREAEEPLADGDPDREADDAVVAALQKSRAPAIFLGGLGILGALVFGACALFLLQKESSAGGGLYFGGLAVGCIVPSVFLWRQSQQVRDFGAIRTTGKLVQILETQNSFLRAAALGVVLVVLVSGVLFLVLLSGPRWD